MSVPFSKSIPKPDPDSLGFHQTPPTGTPGPAAGADWKKRWIWMCRPPGRSAVAVVGEVNVSVIVPSLLASAGALYAHEMHWPPAYLSRVAVKTLLVIGPAARYHCDAPPARYE